MNSEHNDINNDSTGGGGCSMTKNNHIHISHNSEFVWNILISQMFTVVHSNVTIQKNA